MATIIGLTGSPGTGKKTVAPMAARLLGCSAASLNDIAVSHGLVEDPQSGEVDTAALKKLLASELRPPAIVYGHLIPHVLSAKSASHVVVLRCEPGVLKSRLVSRGYDSEKLIGNVEAELIGVVASEAYRSFGPGRTSEVDTTGITPAQAAAEVAHICLEGREKRERIDWTLAYDSGLKLRSLLSST